MEGAELLTEVANGIRSIVDREGAAEVNDQIKAIFTHRSPPGFHAENGTLAHAGRAFARERLDLQPVEFAETATATTHELASAIEALGINDANAIRLALPFLVAAAMEHGRVASQIHRRSDNGRHAH